MHWIIDGMIYLGSALMVYNIHGFIRFARRIRNRAGWRERNQLLYVPIILLLLFLMGYLAVGFFGKPDLIIAGILLGGSIFVFIMYHLLERITQAIQEGEHVQAELLAAEESHKTKSAFLASMSHEMRTPMNVIIGLDALSLKDPTLSPQTRNHLEKIGASARHLLALINNILVMNNADGDQPAENAEAFPIREIIGQVDAIVGVSCEEKGIEYQSCVSADLKNEYIGDEIQLKNILFCLLDNAVKYTNAPGKVTLCVSRTAPGAPGMAPEALKGAPEISGTAPKGAPEAPGTDILIFTVSDTGIGMDEDFLPKVFDVFAREDESSTDSRGGSGLGLAVTKKVVEQLGGTISAVSQKGSGSVFTVAIPYTAAVQEVPEKPADADIPSLEGRRILVAEDIPENAEIIEDLLDLEGAAAEHACNGKEALTLFLQSPPGYYDAILMDLRMPEMDGLTAAKQIRGCGRADARTIPIIALTANQYDSDVRQSKEAGMNEHLAKPIDTDLLYSALRNLIL